MTTQLTLEGYLTAKEKGGTSEAAAKATRKQAVILRARCWKSLRDDGPGTTDEVADRLGESVLSIRPRFTELLRLGMVEKTSETHTNRSGKSARVWRAKA